MYIAVLGVFFLLGATFVLTRIPPLMRSLNTFESWAEVTALADGTPAAGVLDDRADPPPADRPAVRQRINIGLFTVFSQAIQITLVGTRPDRVLRPLRVPRRPRGRPRWPGRRSTDVHVVARWNIGGRALVITDPLLRVAGFLGAFGAMYFTVLLSTDATYREEFADDVAPQLRQALAVRCVYRAARTGA